MPSLRTISLSLLALLLLAGGAFAVAGGEAKRELLGQEESCPPGYVSGEAREREERRERLAQGGEAEKEKEVEGCRSRKGPEKVGDLLAMQGQSGRNARGGQPGVRSGAYASAVRQRTRLAAGAGTLPGSGGAWQPVGTGPLIADDARFDEVNGQGLADLSGRPSDFAFDPQGRRLFAAIGEGGVWVATEKGGYDDWRSMGDPLPTQAVGGIDYSPADGGTVIVSTGDNVFGGGGTFAGLGVFRTTDGGAHWQHATGVPGGVITFKVAVDPSNPRTVYAATGAGLFRSTDAGASFTNVSLPTDTGVPAGQPKCKGAAPDKEGCFLANMVTDVVVQGPGNGQTAGGRPGSVVAVVGWRAGNRQSPPSHTYPSGYVESPNNGVYRSDTGAPGTFTKAAAPGFTQQDRIGRVELGAATGADQDHKFIYAIVEDAEKFRGGAPVVDVPEDETGPIPNTTVLDGVYVSSDFGASWTKMADAEQLKDPTSGSALTGTACATLYCPGVQAWYNQQIAPDPTRQTAAGVPTRLVFGIEEVWQNKLSGQPMDGPTQFKVVGPYFSGTTCLFLNADPPACPTTAGDPTQANKTTHPDQHASLWIPNPDGSTTLVVGNDGGIYTQRIPADQADVNPDGWGRGVNKGLDTLLPYDAQVAKDGTIWAGLQDNGELKIQPDGKQFETYGGDGTYSAVDPDDANTAYEAYVYDDISKTTDGGKTWNSVTPPDDTYQFVNPFTMDPADANHLITAGNGVHETTNGAGEWKTVYDLGTRTHPGDAGATASDADPDNVMSAIDTRGNSQPLPGGPKTADFSFGDGSGTIPGGGSGAPSTYEDEPFTIGAGEGDAKATIKVTWSNSASDWDLEVFRKEGSELVSQGTSAQGGTTEETVQLSKPRPGDYVIRVTNFAAAGTYTGKATFTQASPGDTVAGRTASYVAYCGYCDALSTRPFANGVATNVSPTGGAVGSAGGSAGWHIAAADGLPSRYITSIQADPADPRTVYATLGGYSRRWLPPGVLGEDADLGGGNVYKSTDAGEHFTDISGDLPDIPANFTLVRNGQLIVATNLGVFVSRDTSGGGYEKLGSSLPTAPVLSLELKPKADPREKDTLIAATQGRGVYRYVFADAVKPAPGGGVAAPAGGGAQVPGGSSPRACTASRALTKASVRGAGRGLKIRFSRSVRRPVTVDVFQQSIGRRVIGERLVARFKNAKPSFTWNGRANRPGRGVRDGIFMVRFRLEEAAGLIDNRRIDQQRTAATWHPRPAHYGREGCTLLRSYKLERPVFGGTTRTSLGIAYRLLEQSRVTVTVRHAGKVVKRYRAGTAAPGRTHRLRFAQKRRPRGDYAVTVRAVRGKRSQKRTLTSRKL